MLMNKLLPKKLKARAKVALNDGEGFLLAILTVQDIWKPDKKKEGSAVYGTDDPAAHPGVMQLYDRVHDWGHVGGKLEGVSLPIHYDFNHLRLSPSETVRAFTMNGWRRILGFHTDEDLHCAHREMVITAAREAGAAIFLQPVADLTHPGNLDYYTQIRCYQAFTEKFPPNMIKLGLTPFASRKAGPREALWQAIIRKSFVDQSMVAGRDHARFRWQGLNVPKAFMSALAESWLTITRQKQVLPWSRSGIWATTRA